MTKKKATPKSATHKLALDLVQGVRTEMSRIYRLTLNGRADSAEMGRLIGALKEIRCCLESEAAAADGGTLIDMRSGPQNIINILPVASGVQFTKEQAAEFLPHDEEPSTFGSFPPRIVAIEGEVVEADEPEPPSVAGDSEPPPAA